MNGWSIITSPNDFGSHRPGARVSVTYPVVDLLEDVLNLVLGDAFQQRRRVALSV